MIGTTIRNRYIVTDLIGSGAMGDVYRAADHETDTLVAIKHLKPEFVQMHPEAVSRFIREGEALRELNHPNIVRMIDSVEEDGSYYLIMEYVEGGDLHTLLTETAGSLPIEQVLTIAIELADALTRTHYLGIIHRDLKPANILIADGSSPRLTDFGIAQFSEVKSMTTTSAILGTIPYMSPEILMDEPVTTGSDIWSFGVVLYEILVGERPFRGGNPGALIAAILNDPPHEILETQRNIPGDLIDLIYRMLVKDRAGRIPSVRLVGAELEALIKGTHLTAVVPGSSESAFAVSPVGNSSTSKQHNLPAQTAVFVGRTSELDAIASLVEDETNHLITILGPGGIGKSRLALETARRYLNKYHDGVYFVELAKISDPANIPSVIAEATGYPFSGGEPPADQILDFLSNKQMLLILDNFEHLLSGRDLLPNVLQASPEVTILTTSREKLNLSGETVFVLGSLDFPAWETSNDALDFAAVQLFMQSAQRARVDFKLQADDLTYLAHICQLVEGVPLGILLAAAWVDTLSLQEIAAEIQESIDFLASDMDDLPERQRSMRAAIDYSWKRLSDEERLAFARMSVFRGGCTRKAAQAVSQTSVRMLTTLVGKSLLQRDQESGRFEIHELLRQYAEGYIFESGELEALQAAHARYYLPALTGKTSDLKGGDQLGALNDIDFDFENVRAAWLWAIDEQESELLHEGIEPLALYCQMRGRLTDGEDLLSATSDTCRNRTDSDGLHLWARATIRQEMLDPLGKQITLPADVIGRIHAIAQENGDRTLEGFVQYILGWIQIAGQHMTEAIPYFQRSLALFEEIGESYYQASSLHYIGFCHQQTGFLDEAKRLTTEAANIRRTLGDRFGVSASVNNLGSFENVAGNNLAAIAYFSEALAVADSIDNTYIVTFAQTNLAWVYLKLRKLTEARQSIASAIASARRTNNPHLLSFVLRPQMDLALIEEDYDRLEALLLKGKEFKSTDIQLQVSINRVLAQAALGRRDFGQAEEWLHKLVAVATFEPPKADAVHIQAFLVAHQGEYERATELTAMSHHSPGQLSLDEENRPLYLRLVDDLKSALGEEAFERAWARGAAMDVNEEFENEFGAWLVNLNP